MIEIQNLTKSYGQKGQINTVLKEINLSVRRGEIFGVIGRSGAGKSTLVRCMNRLELPDSGTVKVNGIDLAGLNEAGLRDVRRKIGMIFQHFNLLSSSTVAENIALPLALINQKKESIQARVKELLKLVELENHANHYPAELSGGQKQRVAIARALATNPEVLLSDEATSSLDPETTLSILNLLRKINKALGLTIVMITHEMDVVKNSCHRVAVMDQGEVVEQAAVVDVFASPKSEVTKKLTRSSLKLDLPAQLQEKLKITAFAGGQPIVRLAFVGQQANEPLLANLLEKYSVKANILEADLEYIQEALIGVSVCQLMGDDDNVQDALRYIEQQGIKVEVVGYV